MGQPPERFFDRGPEEPAAPAVIHARSGDLAHDEL